LLRSPSFLLIIYPYAKRFMNVPHALLALAQSIGPIGAWIGVTGTGLGRGVLGLAVASGSAASI